MQENFSQQAPIRAPLDTHVDADLSADIIDLEHDEDFHLSNIERLGKNWACGKLIFEKQNENLVLKKSLFKFVYENTLWKFHCQFKGCNQIIPIYKRAEDEQQPLKKNSKERRQIYRYSTINQHLQTHLPDPTQSRLQDHFQLGK